MVWYINHLTALTKLTNDIFEYDGDNYFTNGTDTYTVYAEDEIDEEFTDYVLHSLYSVDKNVLQEHLRIDLSIQEIADIQSLAYCNGILRKLILDCDYFVRDIKRKMGRGYFLARADGKEKSIKINEITYYIYKQ